MKKNYAATRFQGLSKILQQIRIPSRVIFIALGIVSTLWFLARVIPKPSRASYPCVRATAPWASAFVIYLLSISGAVFSFKKFRKHFEAMQIPLAALFFMLAVGFSVISLTRSTSEAISAPAPDLEEPNSPMGVARGIYPARVVWSFNPRATNENCTNDWGDGYFMDKNTDQAIVDNMVKDLVKKLTEENTIAGAWDAIFKYHNQERGKGSVGYQAGEIVFIKINATSSWGGNFETDDLSRRNNNNYAISETSPQLVTTVLRHLVNELGIAQSDIYIGDPLKHIYKDNYEKWHGEFPDVHYLDYSYNTLGREKVTVSSNAIIDYSDRGAVLREGDWTSALVGDPIHTDNLYTIFEEMEYMINLPTLKGHERAGVTMFAKNHFGSHTRGDAKHLHGGLVNIGLDSLRNQYEMYRVQVDLLSHELLGQKNLIYLMDALFSSDYEVDQPDKFMQVPWNNDWSSSILISQDPIAIESVGFDILYYEMDGSNGLEAYPHFGAVDDYLHQAADEANWPAGITYDPENDGSKIGSLGIHEHWNNPTDMQYSRNLGTGEGIELIKLFPTEYGDMITEENSELPSNQVNTLYIDSSMTAWIGTDAGLSSLSTDGWRHYDTVLLNSVVNDIAYELTSYGKELWVATEGGLTVTAYDDVDGITGSTTYVPENSGLIGRKVSAVAVDPSHNRWVGTDSAVSVFRGSIWDAVLKGIDAMGDNYNFTDYKITDIDILESDTMALISTMGQGIARMSYDEIDGFTGASTYAPPWAGMNTDNVTAISVYDTKQWYGTDVGAYYHPDTQTKSDWILFDEVSGIVKDSINTVKVDAEENAWIGTSGGISIVLKDGGIFNYTETEGLLHNLVNFITTDIDEKIWVATSGGVQIIDGIVGTQVALGTPKLLLPENYTVDTELSVDLEWSAIAGASEYLLQVATDNNFENLVVDLDNINNTGYSLTDLEDDTDYFWRVAANNSSLDGNWTYYFVFSTMYVEGVNDLENGMSISVYPVPFNDHLIIESKENITKARVSIYSLDGRLQVQQIIQNEYTRINTNQLKNGIYIVQFVDGRNEYNFRVVK